MIMSWISELLKDIKYYFSKYSWYLTCKTDSSVNINRRLSQK